MCWVLSDRHCVSSYVVLDDGWAGSGWVDGDAQLHSVLWCMVLWQARKMCSDSADVTGVSMSRARNVLKELSLVEGVYTCNRMTDALLRVAART